MTKNDQNTTGGITPFDDPGREKPQTVGMDPELKAFVKASCHSRMNLRQFVEQLILMGLIAYIDGGINMKTLDDVRAYAKSAGGGAYKPSPTQTVPQSPEPEKNHVDSYSGDGDYDAGGDDGIEEIGGGEEPDGVGGGSLTQEEILKNW